MTGNYRREHLFALQQALALYDFYTEQVQDCDVEIAHQFANLKPIADELPPLPPPAKADRIARTARTTMRGRCCIS